MITKEFFKNCTQKLIFYLDSTYHNKDDNILFYHNQYDEGIHMGYPSDVPQGAQKWFDPKFSWNYNILFL